MGYPDSFQIPVSDTQAYRQFGNSVVVPVVEKIATEVVKSLNLPLDFRPDLVLTMNEKPMDQIPERKRVEISYVKKKSKAKRK